MPVKRIFLPFIAAFIVITPSFGGDIISCDSFEMCEDGNPPLTNYILGLEAKVAELEAEIVARQNDMSGQDLFERDFSGLSLRYFSFISLSPYYTLFLVD